MANIAKDDFLVRFYTEILHFERGLANRISCRYDNLTNWPFFLFIPFAKKELFWLLDVYLFHPMRWLRRTLIRIGLSVSHNSSCFAFGKISLVSASYQLSVISSCRSIEPMLINDARQDLTLVFLKLCARSDYADMILHEIEKKS